MDILDELLVEAMPSAQQHCNPATSPIQKLNYSHEAMIDLIIANPKISQNAIAQRFGYTASWICQIMSSDVFQTKLEKRRAELVDPVVMASVRENFEALVMRSQEILLEKLSGPSSTIPDQLVIQTLNVSSKAAGYGAREQPPPVQTQEVHVHLEQMGEQLTHLLRRKKREAIDVDVEVEQIAGVTAEG
jgi:hypothetical protein